MSILNYVKTTIDKYESEMRRIYSIKATRETLQDLFKEANGSDDHYVADKFDMFGITTYVDDGLEYGEFVFKVEPRANFVEEVSTFERNG